MPAAVADRETPSEELLQQLHVNSMVDFVNPEGFGYRNSQGQVAGFQAHGFSEVPSVSQSMANWKLARVELVSLLKSPQPRVYESEHLPRMDELKSAPTRPATPFEREAIDRLRKGEDLVTHQFGSRLFVVGSLRAMSKCVECHTGKHGDLLGAFCYEFRTAAPQPKQLGPDT
ncbi:MAG: hypothetical protein KDA86_19915 [Planctomycetaceae bacterium]|nr:hypothetical protein [Planctomycetaceae bacterium]